MNLKTISRNVGYALLVSALFMFLSVLISLSEGNDSALAALIISFSITFLVGIFPFIFVRKTAAITLKEGYVIIVLSWLLSFIFGMLPYALWGGPFTISNAWFESVSGFTTTGATILENIESLPDSLLFWRSSTHFIGGLGIVVFLLLIIPSSSPMRLRLANMELSSISRDDYASRANKTIFIFAYVYLGLNAAAFLCYLLAGMSPLDAVCHAFSVCATGGFSTKNFSIASFDSKLIEAITYIFMYLCSIHFGLLFLFFVKRSLAPFKNPVLRFYTTFVAIITVLVGFSLLFSGTIQGFGKAMWTGAFQTMCIATTSGFAIVDNANWPLLPSFLIFMVGIGCGCAGSTSGGLKIDRIYVLLKSVERQIKQILHPSSVNELRLGRRIIREEEISPQVLYVALYFLVIIFSVVLTLMVGVEDAYALSGSLASVGNLGPAIGEIGNFGNYNSIPAMGKFIFTLDMFLGRVEIYPVLAVVGMIMDRRK